MTHRSQGTGQIKESPPSGSADYRLSVIIHAWNDEETIQATINTTAETLATTTDHYEIIVVDNGSSDGTSSIVRKCLESGIWLQKPPDCHLTPDSRLQTLPHVRLVQHAQHLGYTAALAAGLQVATLELVTIIDADSPLDPSELEYMLPLTRRFDVTCGYRIGRRGSLPRRLTSWGYNTLITVLMGSPVRDVNCPLKLFHRAHLQTILPESNNSFADAEMLTKARMQGLSIVEVGVRSRKSLESGVGSPESKGSDAFSDSRHPTPDSRLRTPEFLKTLSSLLPFWWSRVLFRAPNRPTTQFGVWSWASLALLMLIAGSFLFTNLGHPLFRPDESRYAEIGREMLTSGDWVIPKLENEPYYDKPPLFYWLTAVSFWLFGTTELAARLVPALATFLTVLVTFAFGRRIVGARAGFLAALALSLTPGFIHCGRFIILDSVFTLFIAFSLFSAYEAIRGQSLNWSWWIISAIACALALMTKGPVALVLIAPPVLAYGWLNGIAARPRLNHWLAYAGVAFFLAAPWYLAVTLRDPEFAYHFFVKHHLQRFLTGNYHDNPIWFYGLVLLIGCLPWSLLIFPALKFLFSRSAPVGLLRPQAMGFFLLWSVWGVVFFSVSRGKLPPYVLPCVPALAVLFGCYLDHVLTLPAFDSLFLDARSKIPRRAIFALAAGWLVISTLGWFKHMIEATEYVIEFGLCVVCMTGVAIWGRRLTTRMAWIGCAVMMAAIIYESADELIPNWSRQRSPFAESAELTRLLQDKGTAVATYHQRQLALPFELNLGHPPEFIDRPEELKDYLSKQVRSLLVTRSDEDADSMQWALPSGMEMKQVLDAGMARVFLVQSVRQDETLSRR